MKRTEIKNAIRWAISQMEYALESQDIEDCKAKMAVGLDRLWKLQDELPRN